MPPLKPTSTTTQAAFLRINSDTGSTTTTTTTNTKRRKRKKRKNKVGTGIDTSGFPPATACQAPSCLYASFR